MPLTVKAVMCCTNLLGRFRAEVTMTDHVVVDFFFLNISDN